MRNVAQSGWFFFTTSVIPTAHETYSLNSKSFLTVLTTLPRVTTALCAECHAGAIGKHTRTLYKCLFSPISSLFCVSVSTQSCCFWQNPNKRSSTRQEMRAEITDHTEEGRVAVYFWAFYKSVWTPECAFVLNIQAQLCVLSCSYMPLWYCLFCWV